MGALGSRLVLTARVEPPEAGRLAVRILRGGREVLERAAAGGTARIVLPTDRAGGLSAVVTLDPAPGFAAAESRLETLVVLPALGVGAQGSSVRALETLLASRSYTLQRVDDTYGGDTRDAVLAFQKMHGLPRTGRTDPALWRRLLDSGSPVPRLPSGSHFEVDKTRQVLLDVVAGKVVRVVHVSTGATGNTPVGTWRSTPGRLELGSSAPSTWVRLRRAVCRSLRIRLHGCVRVRVDRAGVVRRPLDRHDGHRLHVAVRQAANLRRHRHEGHQ